MPLVIVQVILWLYFKSSTFAGNGDNSKCIFFTTVHYVYVINVRISEIVQLTFVKKNAHFNLSTSFDKIHQALQCNCNVLCCIYVIIYKTSRCGRLFFTTCLTQLSENFMFAMYQWRLLISFHHLLYETYSPKKHW